MPIYAFPFFFKRIFNLIFQVMLVIWWKVMGKPQAIVSCLIVYRIPSFVKYLPGVQWKLIGSHWTEKMVLWYPAQSPTQSLSRIQFPSPDLGRIITEIICQEAYVSTNMTTKVRKRLKQPLGYTLWHYRLWSFKTRDKKLERFLHKNQHTQRKLLNFEIWTNEEPQ